MPAMLMLLLSACHVGDQPDPAFQVVELVVAEMDSEQRLSARAQLALSLSNAARSALERGVPLTLRIQSRLRPDSAWPFWSADIDHAWELRYEALSEHYTLTELTADHQPEENFPRLRYALASLDGQRFTYPTAELTAGDYQLGVRVILDVHRLPTPMRLPALVEADWQLDSDWTEQPVHIGAAAADF